MGKCVYLIKDSEGRYSGSIHLDVENEDSGWRWSYHSETFPTHGHTRKETAKQDIVKIQELNSLSKFNLDWSIEEIDEDTFIEISFQGLNLRQDNSSIRFMEHPKGV